MIGQKAIKGKKEAYAKYKTSDRGDRTEKITVEIYYKENRNPVKMGGPSSCVLVLSCVAKPTSFFWDLQDLYLVMSKIELGFHPRFL